MTCRPRVLFVTPWYPNRHNPVHGNFVLEHALAASKVAEVLVLHCTGNSQALPAEPSLVEDRFFRLAEEQDAQLTRGLRTFRLVQRPVPRPFGSLVHLGSLYKALEALNTIGFKPDILHANIVDVSLGCVLYGRLHGLAVVASEHSSAYATNQLSNREIWEARMAFRLGDCLLPVSSRLSRDIVACGVRPKRVRVVPNVVDLDLFYIPARPAPLGGSKRLLFVGTLKLDHGKGFPDLLRALGAICRRRPELPWSLQVIGEGPAENLYQEMAREMGLLDRIQFCGRLGRGEVAEAMRSSDLLVHPSCYETFGVTVIEAFASGLPVVASQIEGLMDLVPPSCGSLVPLGDAEAWAETILKFLDGEVKLDPSSLRRESEKYSHEMIGKIFSEVYGCCLADWRAQKGRGSRQLGSSLIPGFLEWR